MTLGSCLRHWAEKFFFKAIPHKSARESDERFFVRKRCKTAGILCVFQWQYRINWRRGFSLRFCVGKRQFFAGILCVCQEKITNFQRKRSAVARRHICAVLPKVLLTHCWRKRSVRIRRRIYVVLPFYYILQAGDVKEKSVSAPRIPQKIPTLHG